MIKDFLLAIPLMIYVLIKFLIITPLTNGGISDIGALDIVFSVAQVIGLLIIPAAIVSYIYKKSIDKKENWVPFFGKAFFSLLIYLIIWAILSFNDQFTSLVFSLMALFFWSFVLLPIFSIRMVLINKRKNIK